MYIPGVNANFQLPGIVQHGNRAAVSPKYHIRIAVFRLESGRSYRKLSPFRVKIEYCGKVSVSAEIDRFIGLISHSILNRYVNFLHFFTSLSGFLSEGAAVSLRQQYIFFNPVDTIVDKTHSVKFHGC